MYRVFRTLSWKIDVFLKENLFKGNQNMIVFKWQN